jgi:hypothetical protein
MKYDILVIYSIGIMQIASSHFLCWDRIGMLEPRWYPQKHTW